MKPLEEPIHPLSLGIPSRILLVDDDLALLEGLAQMVRMRLQPVHVDTCHGSAFAVRMVQQGHYDVILCDVWMPETNGLELLPRLREVDPDVSILMMSATLDRNIQNRALAERAIGFVVKPFDRDALTMTLKQALRHHRLSRSHSSSPTAV
jgi:two-component system, response regulator YesN